MAEQRNQTPAGDNTQWTTVIRPRTGWFDVDLEELWRYRDLIVMFVKRNFTVMYKQTILGPLWIILNPLITTVLFNVVFGGIAGLSTDGTPSFLFYMAGNTVWTFFASCINGTANTFVANSQVFGKVYFPRLTTPISQVLTSLINFFIQFVMYILFWVYFAVTGSGVHLTAWAFAVPLVVLEVMLLGLGVGIIVSALTTKYRDLAIAVSFGVQLWMYISPVVYPLSSLEDSPRLQMLMRLNPMTAPIEVFRMGTLGTGTVEVGNLIYSLIFTAAALVLGVVLIFASVVSVLSGRVIDRLGALRCVLPAAGVMFAGLLGMFFARSMLAVILTGCIMMSGYMLVTAILSGVIRDHTPAGKAGHFQGIRMIFGVLLPMIFGPAIGAAVIRGSDSTYVDLGVVKTVPTPSIFLAAAIVLLLILPPVLALKKKEGTKC